MTPWPLANRSWQRAVAPWMPSKQCAACLEDDPLYNAGRGSVLNEYGEVEMDAAIMDGQDLGAGAVAGITNIKNPIALARCVLDQSEHVMLIGKGAMEFAKLHSIECRGDDYFVVDGPHSPMARSPTVGSYDAGP
jgi:beta-aspartyl-peptidase (threonine type)